MRRPWRRRRREAAELNITAFMNLMVVLVPFLLVMAVFSRMTILELNLPAETSAGPANEPSTTLEVVVRADHLVVQTRESGTIRALPHSAEGPDLAGLSALLQQVKARLPDKVDATLLLEPDIDYDTLVQVMDTVRMTTTVRGGEVVKAELFPQISIGDAPALETARAD